MVKISAQSGLHTIESPPAAEEPEANDEMPAEEEEENIDLDEVDDNEPAKETEEEKSVAVYAYEKDENGNLILDENGNPIVTVIEGDEIPVTYLRNEDGELILEDVSGRIRGKNMGDQRLALFTHEEALLFGLLRLLYNKAPGKESSTDNLVRKIHRVYQLKQKKKHEIMSRFFRQNGVPLC